MFERRCFEGSKFEIRNLEGEGRKLYGTFIVFGSLSQDLGGFVERFMPGSVSDTIRSGSVTAILDHDENKHVASQAAGTLRLFDDQVGAHAEFDLPDASYVRDFLSLNNAKRQEHRGMSFGFMPVKGGEKWMSENGGRVREISKARLHHVSPVITPAYAATSFNVRDLADDPEMIDHAERYGVDLDKLAAVLVAIKRNLPLDKNELDIARYTVSLLRSRTHRPLLAAAEDKAASLLV